ncbi:MAG: MinD/ParA family protein [Candidatus Riflebacteria bacterium]|nr:MinD/ParA family protein [Candidatus Riflebacteria bacterium]
MVEQIVKPIDSIIADSRKQIQPYVFKRLESRRPRLPGKKIAKVITITSGKGGVGKTNLVANMAICLAQAGRKVIVLDADLGLANIDVIFGIRPKKNITEVLNGTCTLEEVIVPGPCGVQIIAGGSGISELAHLNPEASKRLFSELRLLEDKTDYLLIDTGAGISQNVISFCLAADQIIVVTTPEPTALADAYGVIKVVSQQREDSNLWVLVNRAENQDEAGFILNRIQTVAWDFLKFRVQHLGYIPQDKFMYLSVRQQTPLMLFSPMSPAALQIRYIISNNFYEKTTENDVNKNEIKGIEGFIDRLSRLWNWEKA